jgi:hypothetical protein
MDVAKIHKSCPSKGLKRQKTGFSLSFAKNILKSKILPSILSQKI